jgi:hypothetical protein
MKYLKQENIKMISVELKIWNIMKLATIIHVKIIKTNSKYK